MRELNDLPYEVAQLILELAARFNVPARQIVGPGRPNRVALARQVAMTICRGDAQRLTLQEVGDLFGREHGTVIHATKVIASRLRSGDHELAEIVAAGFRVYSTAKQQAEQELRERLDRQREAGLADLKMKGGAR